jgi:hypothetical protein
MNEKRAVLYTLQGTHSKVLMHIKFHRGLRNDMTHSHIAKVGQTTANGELSRAQMQGFTKRTNPRYLGTFFSMSCPL